MRHHRLVLTRHNKLVMIYEDGGLMPSPNEKLAESLDVLKAIQEGNQRVFRSDDLSRVHRERLVDNGFLQEVMKGWLISSSPDRSEEHTSELQSQSNLVCRLLLEKKKTIGGCSQFDAV